VEVRGRLHDDDVPGFGESGLLRASQWEFGGVFPSPYWIRFTEYSRSPVHLVHHYPQVMARSGSGLLRFTARLVLGASMHDLMTWSIRSLLLFESHVIAWIDRLRVYFRCT
jgi:hypothetical protein